MRPVQYMGWDRRGNFGDDALRQFWEFKLSDHCLLDTPLYRAELLADSLELFRRRRYESPILLGGGTVIGFQSWFKHARSIGAITRSRCVVTLGAGVSNLDRDPNERQAVSMSRWVQESRIRILGVRGPWGAETLKAAGVDVPVVGDPVLFLPKHLGNSRRTDGNAVAVSVGGHGGEAENWLESNREIARGVSVIAQGATVIVLQLSVEDRAQCDSLYEMLRGKCEDVVIVRYTNVDEIFKVLTNCSLLISERLHGCVAAVSLGVATVSLGYRAKCYDFMASVGLERFVIDPRRLESAALVTLAEEALDMGTRRIVTAHVTELASRFEVQFRALTTLLNAA